jgi:hypothetical protein
MHQGVDYLGDCGLVTFGSEEDDFVLVDDEIQQN